MGTTVPLIRADFSAYSSLRTTTSAGISIRPRIRLKRAISPAILDLTLNHREIEVAELASVATGLRAEQDHLRRRGHSLDQSTDRDPPALRLDPSPRIIPGRG